MRISQDPQELKSAQSIQNRVELRRILLSTSECSRFGDEREFETPFSLAFTHECRRAHVQGSTMIIELQFVFEGKDSSQTERTMFQMACGFELTYELAVGPQEPTQDEIDAFKNGNAIFNIWPYVREFVQQTATRMGFQPPPIPLLRFGPKLPIRQELATAGANAPKKPSGRVVQEQSAHPQKKRSKKKA